MSVYAKKLIFAALLSLVGIASSYGWYVSTDTTRVSTTSKVIAHLDYQKNEVQRRVAKHVIWERVEEGEDLHTGEAVRTAPDAEAKILFLSGAEVDLDPESVVVIEDSGDKVNLDFVKGNLVVKGGNASEDLSLKSGNTSIALNKADVSLGKSATKGVDVQVLKGSAQLSNGGKTLTLDQTNKGTFSDDGMDVTKKFFKDLQPAVSDKLYIKLGDAAHFKWAPVAQDYDVHLEVGSTRDNLKQAGQPVPGTKGELTMNLSPGNQFWKLVAVSKKDPKDLRASAIVLNAPPKLLSPRKDEQVALNSENQKVDLRWANPSKLSILQIEVSQDPNFTKPLITQSVEDTGLFNVSLKTSGDYFWRLTGWRAGSNEGLRSEVVKFSVRTHFELLPPDLKGPAAEARLPFESVNSGASYLSWQPTAGVNQYHVYLEDEKSRAPIFDKEMVDLTQVKIPPLKPGRYFWTVTSLNGEGKQSPRGTGRFFSVEDVPALPWADHLQQENYFYVTEKPTLKPVWSKPAKGDYKLFHIIVKSDDGTPDLVQKTDGKDSTVSVPHDGLYHVVVEALDAGGMPLARTAPRDFFVEPKPLLATAFPPVCRLKITEPPV